MPRDLPRSPIPFGALRLGKLPPFFPRAEADESDDGRQQCSATDGQRLLP